ncbi:MAG: signal peptidase II [Clostridia bacterium]|nr:signal peptidase II [Clostridia bacterium]
MLIPFFTGILIIGILDQAAKFFAAGLLQSVDTYPLWNEVFHLTYVENKGAGWGMFSDHTWLLTVATIIVIVAAVSYVVVKRPKDQLFLTAFTFMIGGAVGNLVDRVRQGFVIDFLDFTLIDFPVFNIADCFITIGAAIFVIYVIFFSDKKES